MDTNRIEKKILLRAKQSRVWQALTDSREFGSWFGVKLDGPFTVGAKVRGVIVPTTVDPESAKTKGPYDGKPIEWVIVRIEPQRLFSFRWHPYAVEPGIDYSKEPMTLVTFTLEEKGGGVLLTVTESGFDGIPLARRAEAFKANEGGWSIQLERIEKYLAHAS
jgi:uncharacterized protein YndB with AHSA1/START domain